MRRTSAKLVLAMTTSLCAGALTGAASAQQTPAAPEAPPAASQTQPRQSEPQSGQGYGMGRGHGMGSGHGMGRGYGYGGRNMSEQDRAAFFSAHLAAVRAGLTLSPEQDKLWPPLEAAVREGARQRQEWRERSQKEGRPASPIDAMRRMAEMSSARGETLKRIADSAAPLYGSLSDDQKRRLHILAHGRMGAMMGLDSGSGYGADREGRGEGHGQGREIRGRGDHEGRGGYGRHHDHHEGERGPRWRQGQMDHEGPRYGRGGRDASNAAQGFDRGAGQEDWRRL